MTVAVRSGNIEEPDSTWSDWSAEQTDPENARAAAPPARFLQYRVTLSTDNPNVTPAVTGLTVRYVTTNQAPEVTQVCVKPSPRVASRLPLSRACVSQVGLTASWATPILRAVRAPIEAERRTSPPPSSAGLGSQWED